jgi:hypothetical protein
MCSFETQATDSKAGYLAIQGCLSDSTVLVRLVLIFPTNLKALWKLQKDLEARYGRPGVIMGIGLQQQGVLSSGQASETRFTDYRGYDTYKF